uniref:pH-sensitive chloride channel 2 n=2 Tax=Culex tarsalis TaxID=7177 RepID=A0A1Q3FX45_CULTA
MQSTVVLLTALLLTVMPSFAQDDPSSTALPPVNTPANLANETELIDANELTKAYESTLASESSSSSTTTSSTTPQPPPTTTTPHNSSDSVGNTTEPMTQEEIQRLLLPPAKVEASIAHLEDATDEAGGSTGANGEPSEKSVKDPNCPSLENANALSQTQLLSALTHGCRYDRLERPMAYADNGTKLPVEVFARAYIYFLQNLEAHDLQFKIHALLQLRYVDSRLVFKKVAPNRTEPIMGEQSLRDVLWVPHVFLANERSSDILGTAEKDILTSVSPDGTVIISTRISATLYCWMNLQKFPFDEQHCSTVLESWMYNQEDLVLKWEKKSPVTLAPELHLTEYVLLSMFTNETMINADLSDLRHGAFAGNYSSLSFTVHLAREMGFYLMDYFIPSIMLVTISWVTFWLQADQSAPRITLGTSTMLTFITLASAQGKTLPKVSYIKASEIWFLGCTGFIFGSLVEFAFVNTIWRRKKNVELKKKNSKYIFKSLTPLPSRKDIGGLQKSHSCTSLDGQATVTATSNSFNNYLTVHSFPSKSNIPAITTSGVDSNSRNGDISIRVEDTTLMGGDTKKLNPGDASGINGNGWTTMTPQEIAIWIDKRSRFVFPICFLIFNVFYWTFVYVV